MARSQPPYEPGPPALPQVPAAGPVPPLVPDNPCLTEPQWITICQRASIKQLDAVHYARVKGAPQHLTKIEQYLWWAPPDTLEDERNAKQRANGWRDLPPLKRAEMLQLETDERKARQRGDVTAAFAVNLALSKSPSGEFDVHLTGRGVQWTWLWTIAKPWVIRAALAAGGAAATWVAVHAHRLMEAFK